MFQTLLVVWRYLWWKLVLSYHRCLASQVDFDDPVHEVSVTNKLSAAKNSVALTRRRRIRNDDRLASSFYQSSVAHQDAQAR